MFTRINIFYLIFFFFLICVYTGLQQLFISHNLKSRKEIHHLILNSLFICAVCTKEHRIIFYCRTIVSISVELKFVPSKIKIVKLKDEKKRGKSDDCIAMLHYTVYTYTKMKYKCNTSTMLGNIKCKTSLSHLDKIHCYFFFCRANSWAYKSLTTFFPLLYSN